MFALKKTMEFTEAGLLSLTALFLGFLGGLLSCVLRSRCETIRCCGSECTRRVIEAPDTRVTVA
jgi:hypothetical protein